MRLTGFLIEVFSIFAALALVFLLGIWMGWASVQGDCDAHGHFTYDGRTYHCSKSTGARYAD